MKTALRQRMCRITASAVCVLAVCGTSALAQEGEAEPGEDAPPIVDASKLTTADIDRILDRLDDLFRSASSIAEVELTVVKPRRTRTMSMKMWTLGEEKALIVIQSPAREKDTATLKVDKNLWNYLPRIGRTIRIPPSMMLGSWMGSDFTNDDLVRDSSLRKDFDARLLGKSAKPAGWAIELKAKEGTVGLWDRIEYVLNPSATLPLEAKYYDRKGRLSRVMQFTDVRQFGKRRIPSRMLLIPIDKTGNPEKGRQTQMLYKDIEFDADVPESTFNLSRLEQAR
jgi:outer membrane lipoprotein-sorting protein